MSSISLVIATLNRGEDLVSLLKQIQQLEFKPNEVIVIDQSDNYPITIQNELTEILSDDALGIIYENIKIKSSSYARNYGVKIASSEYIVFIDDDVILSTDFFERYSKIIHSDLDFDAIAGKVLGLDEETTFVLPKEFEDKYVGFMFRPMNYGHPLPNSDLGTCNMMIKKSVFQKLKGFDENLKRLEDSDFAARFLKNGFKSYYEPSISLIHKLTSTGAARDITINTKPYQNHIYWAQYFYFTQKNVGLHKGKTLLLHYIKNAFLVKGYLVRPKRLFLALKEVYTGYKLAAKTLKNN